MSALQVALDFTLRMEGGYVNDPRDPGGATNMGVTQTTYDQWRKSHRLTTRLVKDITREEVEAIYRENYWLKAGCDQIEPLALAISLFDFAVNSGVNTALRYKANTSEWVVLNARRLAYLASLTNLWPTFGRGWANRIAALNEYVAGIQPVPPPTGLVFQVVGEHDLWVDNRPTLGKGMAMISAALTGKPAVFAEPVKASRTKRASGWKLDIARLDD